MPLVANNANLKQAEKQQRTRADFSQVMSQFIIQVLYVHIYFLSRSGSGPAGSLLDLNLLDLLDLNLLDLLDLDLDLDLDLL